jgi:hypothetical protein
MENLKLGLEIEVNEESIKQLENILKLVKQINSELDKINNNQLFNNINITINCSNPINFGDQDNLREFAIMVSKQIAEEEFYKK